MGAIQRAINQVAGLASIYAHIFKQSPARQEKLNGNKAESKPAKPETPKTAPSSNLQDEMSKATAERTKAQQASAAAQRAQIKEAYKAVRSYPVMGEPIAAVAKQHPELAQQVLKHDTRLQDLVKKTLPKE